jgi:hypothetical protein
MRILASEAEAFAVPGVLGEMRKKAFGRSWAVP